MNFNIADIISKMGGFKNHISKMQEHLATLNITGEAGAGMVKITMNGNGIIQKIDIDDNLINVNEKEILQELIKSAMIDVNKKVKESMQHELKKITGGFNIPGLENFFT